jgi:effector-binding domain-containing protein
MWVRRALSGAAAAFVIFGAAYLARRNDIAPPSARQAEAATSMVVTPPPAQSVALQPAEAPAIVDVEPQLVAILGASAPRNSAAVAQALGAAYARITAYLEARDIQMAGAPMMATTEIKPDRVHFEAGIPVAAEAPYDPGTGVRIVLRPGGRAVKAVNVGPYESLDGAYARLDAFVAANGLEPTGQPWESYVDDPTLTAPEQLRTEVFVPVR